MHLESCEFTLYVPSSKERHLRTLSFHDYKPTTTECHFQHLSFYQSCYFSGFKWPLFFPCFYIFLFSSPALAVGVFWGRHFFPKEVSYCLRRMPVYTTNRSHLQMLLCCVISHTASPGVLKAVQSRCRSTTQNLVFAKLPGTLSVFYLLLCS